MPVILLPLHKSTQYLETGLVAFWTIIGLIIFNIYQLKTLRIFCIVLIISLFTLSATSAILQRTTYWAAERGRYAKQLIKQLTAVYPVLPKGAILHIATFDEKGIIIIDIWENEEDFNNFVQKRLLPVTDKLIDTKPKIEILPLYALFLRNKE